MKVVKLKESELIKIIHDVILEQPKYPEIQREPARVDNTYNARISKEKIKNDEHKISTNPGFLLFFIFPDYEPTTKSKEEEESSITKASRWFHGASKKGTYGKTGHGGCVLVKTDGSCGLYEFGIYNILKDKLPAGKGTVAYIDLGNIAKVEYRYEPYYKYFLNNPEDIMKIAKSKTQGSGPNLKANVAVFEIPNIIGSENYAKSLVGKPSDYFVVDLSLGGNQNCATFVASVAKHGGFKGLENDFLGYFSGPYPSNVLSKMESEKKPIKKFSI